MHAATTPDGGTPRAPVRPAADRMVTLEKAPPNRPQSDNCPEGGQGGCLSRRLPALPLTPRGSASILRRMLLPLPIPDPNHGCTGALSFRTSNGAPVRTRHRIRRIPIPIRRLPAVPPQPTRRIPPRSSRQPPGFVPRGTPNATRDLRTHSFFGKLKTSPYQTRARPGRIFGAPPTLDRRRSENRAETAQPIVIHCRKRYSATSCEAKRATIRHAKNRSNAKTNGFRNCKNGPDFTGKRPGSVHAGRPADEKTGNRLPILAPLYLRNVGGTPQDASRLLFTGARDGAKSNPGT